MLMFILLDNFHLYSFLMLTWILDTCFNFKFAIRRYGWIHIMFVGEIVRGQALRITVMVRIYTGFFRHQILSEVLTRTVSNGSRQSIIETAYSISSQT